MMKTELKIVRLFLDDKKSKTIRVIAQQIIADYRITHTAVQRLIKKKVLFVETIGSSSLCSLNDQRFSIELCEAENERKEEHLKNGSLRQLHKEILSKVRISFFVLLLFGSYAKKKKTKKSDIDLLFISNEREAEKNISDILSLIPLKVHSLVFTEEEFLRMKNAKKPNVVQEAIEHNVVLYGVETYYKMKHA